MGQLVFITATNPPEANEIEPSSACAKWFNLSGEYFFLYPDFLDLQKKTGQLVDCITDAFFIGHSLEMFEELLFNAKKRVLSQPESWSQRVGKELPSGKPIYETASRKKLVEMIDKLIRVAATARERQMGILFCEV